MQNDIRKNGQKKVFTIVYSWIDSKHGTRWQGGQEQSASILCLSGPDWIQIIS